MSTPRSESPRVETLVGPPSPKLPVRLAQCREAIEGRLVFSPETNRYELAESPPETEEKKS